MKTISVAYKLKALHRIARQGRIWGEEMSRSNQEQRKILSFARRHGDVAACDAYEVSGRTLRRWRKLARTRGEAFLGDCRGGRSGRRSGRKAFSLYATLMVFITQPPGATTAPAAIFF